MDFLLSVFPTSFFPTWAKLGAGITVFECVLKPVYILCTTILCPQKAKKEGKRSAAASTVTPETEPESKKSCAGPSTSNDSSSTNGSAEVKSRLTNGDEPSKLTNGSREQSKFVNEASKSKLAIGGAALKSKLSNGDTKGKKKTIQDDPKASSAYKSLFNTCDAAKKQTQGHWVTFNPQYF